ncbi:MAG TPA: LCP family protein [Phototrophicaceae bacterium]|nr:LCP family protein [Phototrophicaceae bacterium]
MRVKNRQPGARRWRWSRWGCALLAFLALLLPILGCGLVLVTYLVFPPPPIAILILGVDGRGNEGFISRTDSIMLVGIDPAHLRVSLLSIPRDTFIEVPNYGLQRINTINVLGEQEQSGNGPKLLADSLAQDFSIQPDRYIRLNFDAFIELVDAVGGVAIDVERTLVDDAYPTEDGGVMSIRFDSGVQYMDGERALMYARTRHADDDYQRAARQQQVVAAVVARLVNPLHWPSVLGVLQRNVDTNLTLVDLLQLAPPVLLSGGRFDQLVINRDYLIGTADGYAVPNYELILPWLRERFG